MLCSLMGIGQNRTSHLPNVQPLIGTNRMGHTFPGATVPFGMVQLSPETNQEIMFEEGKYNPDTYKYCAGYQYEDSTIFGFSHTHFSGTGHSDLGDFLIMPVSGNRVLEPGNLKKNQKGYYSNFSHENEIAEPNYYKVHLDKYNVDAELTTSTRVGFHKYSFHNADAAPSIILDLVSNIYNYEGKNIWSQLRVENDTLVTGYRQTSGWARNKTIYFAMRFSKPIQQYGNKRYDPTPYSGFWRRFNQEENFPEMAGKEIRAWFEFEKTDEVLVKFAMSSVSTEGALNNLETEIPHWNFEKTKREGQQKWEEELSQFEVETLDQKSLETFYTALYHTKLGPIEYMDVDGKYRGLDNNIHQAEGFTNYTIFSLWDTYRALHPLFNITNPARNRDMIVSMLQHYKQSVHGMLPIWSHYANENWCMIGYHSVSVIADAMAKGNSNFDKQLAYEAMLSTSNYGIFDGLKWYKKLGYIPEDKNSNSVSKTLEFAYDDWCIAQVAAQLGDPENQKVYLERAQSFNHVFNSKSGYMQPKLTDGSWRPNFDPLSTHGQGFIEGNSWNYSLFVPHDIPKMIDLMGGKDKFSGRLDQLFDMHLDDKYFAHTEDITRDGIIGNYVHGNEPGHHIPYLYNWTNQPWKTQKKVRLIMDTMYSNDTDGLCGNDDAGQMSAWYVFSALGFYPVNPGSDWYAIGSPSVKNAKLTLENGNTFSITAHKQSTKNVYIQSVKLNGKRIDRNYITHEEIIMGGSLEYTMGAKPNKKWGLIAPN